MSSSPKTYAWQPTPEQIAQTRLMAFMKENGIADYDTLLERSNADPAWFWDTLLKRTEIQAFEPYTQVLDLSRGKPWARWCVGGTTNVVLNCLDRYVGTPVMEQEAVVWEGEDGAIRRWTYARLNDTVSQLAEGLRSLGLGKGDMIGLYVPMLPESVAAFHAIAKIGGIVMPLFSGFGANALAVRMNDAGCKAVITVDGTLRRGQAVNLKQVLDQAAGDVPTLEHVIVIRNRDMPVTMQPGRDHWAHDLMEGKPTTSRTEPMQDDEPLMVVFTSGTTGKAKGTVHSHWGFMGVIARDLGMIMEFSPGDRLLWISDMGWVVGPLVSVSSLMFQATAVLVEGGPDYPGEDRVWRLIEDHKVTVMGIAPTIVRSLMRYGADKPARHDLSTLRMAVSTGEPWNPDSWTWFHQHILGGDKPIMNISGGTETGASIVTNTLIHPMNPCTFAGPAPGTGADVVDPQGNSVSRGQVGELVVRTPFISLTRSLWQDDERYMETYWNKIPDMWVHGDWAMIDEDGFWYILGRSDDAFNVAGKRTGPSEVEALVMAAGGLAEAAVVGVPDDIKGEAVVCVCVPAPGVTPDAALDEKLSKAVMDGLGKPYKPREIIYVHDLPKTRSMKVMRRVVKAVYMDKDPGDMAALVNPEAVEDLKATLRGRQK